MGGDLSGFTSDKLSSQSKIRHLTFIRLLQGKSTAVNILPEQIDLQSYMWSLGGTTICIYAICMKLEVNNINTPCAT